MPSKITLLISLRLKNEGGGQDTVFNSKLGKIRKERKYVGLKIKLSERRAHSVSFYLYKSKYSTINIPSFLSQFQKCSPPCTKQCQELCAAQTKNKTKAKQNKNKTNIKNKTKGEITVFLLTLFVSKYDREYIYLGLRPWVQVWVRVRVLYVKKSRVRVRDQVHGCRYKLSYPY